MSRVVCSSLLRLWRNDDGQDIAEYALMLTLILLIVAAAVSGVGTAANNIFSNVAGQLSK